MGEEVRGAVFGNVGTVMSFRVSPDDAPFLQKYFEPEFEAANLIQQHSRFFVISMMIDGEKAPAFSAKTLNLPQPPDDNSAQIIELTRQRYSRNKIEVEARVRETAGLPDIVRVDAAPKSNPQTKPTPREQIVKLATGLTHPDKPASPETTQPTRRKRSRRRKASAGQAQPPAQASGTKPRAEASGDEQVIRLR